MMFGKIFSTILGVSGIESCFSVSAPLIIAKYYSFLERRSLDCLAVSTSYS